MEKRVMVLRVDDFKNPTLYRDMLDLLGIPYEEEVEIIMQGVKK